MEKDIEVLLSFGLILGISIVGFLFIVFANSFVSRRARNAITLVQKEMQENIEKNIQQNTEGSDKSTDVDHHEDVEKLLRPTSISSILHSSFIRYIENNHSQNRLIPIATLGTIFVALGMMCFVSVYGIIHIERPISSKEILYISAGAFAEFISGTILIVYKTLFQQTVEYFRTIERMIYVEASAKLIDDLPHATKEEKDIQTKAKIDFSNTILAFHRTVSSEEKSKEEVHAKSK